MNSSPAPGMPPRGAKVTDINGMVGICTGLTQHESEAEIEVGNMRLLLPRSMIEVDAEDFKVPMAFADLEEADLSESLVLPVTEEEVDITKRSVDTGRGIDVKPKVTTREELVEVPVTSDELVIERISIGTLLDHDQEYGIREDNGAIVIPVIEEVIVVEKRRRLVEEVRVVRRSVHRLHQETVTLKKHDVEINRFDDNEVNGGTKR
jgi:uncharacterized protein (TIGR02271 family)